MDVNLAYALQSFLLPIFICVVLPVSIVLMLLVYRNKALTRKAEIMKLAIEKGLDADACRVITGMDGNSGKKPKSKAQYYLERLVVGIVLFLIGIAVVTVACICDYALSGVLWLSYLCGAVLGIVGIGNIVMYIAARKMGIYDKKQSGSDE